MKVIKFNIGVLVYNGSGKVVCKKYFLVMLFLIFTFLRLCTDTLDSQNIQLTRMKFKYSIALEIFYLAEDFCS